MWVEEAELGRIDHASRRWLARVMGAFDWAAASRIAESGSGPAAAVLVLSRSTQDGVVTRIVDLGVDATAHDAVLRWGMRFSAATGADRAQVWRVRGQAADLAGLGFASVRPYWRMDRPDLDNVPDLPLPAGYRLLSEDQEELPDAAWVGVYNDAFASHWRHAAQTVESWRQMRDQRDPGLTLVAVHDDEVAACVWCDVDRYERDARPQPVGVVGTVGTVPRHRRRGLAAALMVEGMHRMRARGAASASLYVDGLNPTGAANLYRRLGFDVGLELDVLEAAPG
jgi:mycothiol synthase